MTDTKRPDRVLPDEPLTRPLERFWPYADLSEQPSEEELLKLRPELREVLFGETRLPFSISIDFPAFEGENYARALELAKAADEYHEINVDGRLRHRARFFPGDRPTRLRDLFQIVDPVRDCQVLVDDQPMPYARELWLPLVWFLIR